MPKPTVVFDLDGTLADTSGDLIAAANAALAQLGHAPQIVPGADDPVAFAGGRAMLRLAHDRLGIGGDAAREGIEHGYPLLLAAYGDHIDVHTRLYPGALEAVEALRGAGYLTTICTNKPEALAETLLARLGVRDRFDVLIGADTLPTRKPDPAPYRAAVEDAGGAVARSLLVGDTITDLNTARAVGVPCLLVGFGPTGAAVAELGPDAILGHFDDLPALVARMLPH